MALNGPEPERSGGDNPGTHLGVRPRAHIIRKVLLRQIAITNYINPF